MGVNQYATSNSAEPSTHTTNSKQTTTTTTILSRKKRLRACICVFRVHRTTAAVTERERLYKEISGEQ